MKTALITGVSGQDGSYLAELLIGKDYRVVGTVRSVTGEHAGYFDALRSRIDVRSLDVRNRPGVEALMKDVRPDEVYHLAAQSRVGASWDDPVGTAEVCAMGALYVLQAVRDGAPNARVLVAGSCEVYGSAGQVPQNEATAHAPTSPYGVAKSFAQAATAMYRRRYGLRAATAILFNHESPRRARHFVSRKIAQQAVQIARKEATELHLGNVQVIRDWGFAGDFVDAMWRMLQLDDPEDLVIGTGVGHSVWELCEAAFRVLGLDAREFVRIDEGLVRRDDAPALVADPSRARSRLGWTPTVDFDTLVRMLVAAEQDPSSA